MPPDDPNSAAAATPAPSGTPAAAPAPAAPPASATPPSPPTIDALLAAMDDPKTRDSFFAEMRRTGRIKGASKPASAESTTPEAMPPARAPETEMVSRADLARERAFTRSIAVHGQSLTGGQLSRMERAFEAEKPSADAVGEWVAGYIADLGLTKAPVAATTAPAPPPVTTPAAPAPAAAATPPVTSAGAPAAPASNIEAIDFLSLKPAERDALIERMGVRKFNDAAMAQMRNRKVTVTR